jgi:ABC-type Fe3+/spermidine/putrescine transport system ATPase subunit
VIEVRELCITLGEFQLRDINFAVQEGEYSVILGPTGSGKTVLIECIVGLHKPSHGRVFLDGVDVTGLKPEERRVAYVPQDYCLFPHMTVRQNIEFGVRRRKWAEADIRQSVDRLVEMTHISGLLNRHPLTLSGGEKQRVALCRALAVKPRVLLLDEPLAAVDERTRELVCRELKTVQRELRTTTIHVSHNFEETLAVADKIGVFRSGRIVQSGTAFEIFRQPNSEFVALFTGAENVFCCRVEQGVCKLAGSSIRIAADPPPGVQGDALMVIRPEDVRLHPIKRSTDQPINPLANSFEGTVSLLVDKGAMFKVLVESQGLEWSALISRRECLELGVQQSAPVLLEAPAQSVHVIPAA